MLAVRPRLVEPRSFIKSSPWLQGARRAITKAALLFIISFNNAGHLPHSASAKLTKISVSDRLGKFFRNTDFDNNCQFLIFESVQIQSSLEIQ